MKLIRAAFLAVLSVASFASTALAESVVIRAGKMLDVERGQYLPDRAIRIEDGRIVSATPWTSNSRSGEECQSRRLTGVNATLPSVSALQLSRSGKNQRAAGATMCFSAR